MPEGWVWCRGYSCFKGMESLKPQGEYFDYIDIDAIDNKSHKISAVKHLLVKEAPSRASRKLENGSVLFSFVRPYLENIAFVDENFSHCIASTGFYICNSNGIINPNFMFVLMTSKYVIDGLNSFMKGDNSPSIKKEEIENFLYPIPPISEQQRIIDRINSVFPIIENLAVQKNNLQKESISIKSKILDLAIRGKLVPQDPNDEPASVLLERIRAEKEELIKQGKIKRDKKESVIFKGDDNSYYEDLPDQWVETKLSTISEVITKGTTPRGGKVAYTDNGIGFLRAENIAGYEKLALNNLNYVDEKSHSDFLKRSILKANDILITIAGTLGRTAVVPCEALPLNTNQAVAIVRLVNCKLVNVKFIIFAINSPAIKKDLLMQSVDMAIPNLSLENISNCTIPLPPLAEQRRIVHTIEALFAQIDKIVEQIS